MTSTRTLHLLGFGFLLLAAYLLADIGYGYFLKSTTYQLADYMKPAGMSLVGVMLFFLSARKHV